MLGYFDHYFFTGSSAVAKLNYKVYLRVYLEAGAVMGQSLPKQATWLTRSQYPKNILLLSSLFLRSYFHVSSFFEITPKMSFK